MNPDYDCLKEEVPMEKVKKDPPRVLLRRAIAMDDHESYLELEKNWKAHVDAYLDHLSEAESIPSYSESQLIPSAPTTTLTYEKSIDLGKVPPFVKPDPLLSAEEVERIEKLLEERGPGFTIPLENGSYADVNSIKSKHSVDAGIAYKAALEFPKELAEELMRTHGSYRILERVKGGVSLRSAWWRICRVFQR